jgi:hypothetical protein
MAKGIPNPWDTLYSRAAQPTATATSGTGVGCARMTFFITVPGRIVGANCLFGASNFENHIVTLRHRFPGGDSLVERAGRFRRVINTAVFNGWNTAWFRPLYRIVPNDWYDLVVYKTGSTFLQLPSKVATTAFVVGPIHVPANGATDPAGNVVQNGTFTASWLPNPNVNISGNLPLIDVLFQPD